MPLHDLCLLCVLTPSPSPLQARCGTCGTHYCSPARSALGCGLASWDLLWVLPQPLCCTLAPSAPRVGPLPPLHAKQIPGAGRLLSGEQRAFLQRKHPLRCWLEAPGPVGPLCSVLAVATDLKVPSGVVLGWAAGAGPSPIWGQQAMGDLGVHVQPQGPAAGGHRPWRGGRAVGCTYLFLLFPLGHRFWGQEARPVSGQIVWPC